MGRKSSFKKYINYTVFAAFLFFGYKYFVGDHYQKPNDPFRDTSRDHPKNIQPEKMSGKTQDKEDKPVLGKDELERPEQVDARVKPDDARAKIDVGEIPKNVGLEKEPLDAVDQEQKKLFEKPIENRPVLSTNKPRAEKHGPEGNPFLNEVIDWELEEEMIKRRAKFFAAVKAKEEQINEGDDMNLSEPHDDITFVTAGSHSTFYATIQFIYSVQYFYPRSTIAIYDIGLTSDEKAFIKSLCNTVLASMLLKLWPENLYKIRHRIWRPFLLQFALVRFGHCVYVEPGRFIYRQIIKDYLEQSRVHGLVVGGKQMQHSSYFVTNPHMYTFLITDERKLKNTPHFEMSLIILHNTRRVHHFFMRYLTSCATEEYCISPPGAQPKCETYLGGKKYGGCHRYDESAINLILNKWHHYSPKEYLMNDLITRFYDGTDMTKKVKVCNKKEEV
ncbi:unnamed protein product [Candidula unifasciata]|uniref:Uncharacterized protein n=1 Tax=Candidula unifasciata TaxID=100452 RepID=A0A8S3YS12_9EUPU|nr:unnamed protein product [Candidula unifasciata]